MSERYDVLIRSAIVVDGTGAPRFDADLGIRGDRIARIGRLDGDRGESSSRWSMLPERRR